MNTSRHSVSALSERVGYVQQDPEAQLFCSSVEDEIAFPLENRGVAPSIIDKQIDIMLDLVGMAGYRKRVPTSLSGGQMQRVAIAAALAAEPVVLILDEPTAALDPEGKQEVFDVLDRIRQTRSMTVIMAEQDTEHIAYWADQVLFMVQTDDRMLRLGVVPYRQRLDDWRWSVTHPHAGGFQQSTFPGK